MIANIWPIGARIERNNFIYKSLSCWSLNVAVGCSHACRFCYVPSASTNKLAPKLEPMGVSDPDAQWGNYAFPRSLDFKTFRASLRKAEETPDSELNRDGNRAVMLCTTTDPYMVIPESPASNEVLQNTVRNSLRTILEESTLNVRILTRGPLAKRDFDLFAEFGPRLLFGMSLPTLDNKLARIYEPHAPSPSARLATLQAARKAGLNIYVAMAPTYPECDGADLRRTLTAIAELRPRTIFHEPINIRAENVARIETHAASLGLTMRTDVFKDTQSWAKYARKQLEQVHRIWTEEGLEEQCGNRLHLWPDKNLPRAFGETKFDKWCAQYWNRISEWKQ